MKMNVMTYFSRWTLCALIPMALGLASCKQATQESAPATTEQTPAATTETAPTTTAPNPGGGVVDPNLANLKDHVCTAACKDGNHVYAHGEKSHTCTDACKNM